MTNLNLLTNKSMESIIKDTPLITGEQKKQFMQRLPYLDGAERIELPETLKNIIALDKEKQAITKESAS